MEWKYVIKCDILFYHLHLLSEFFWSFPLPVALSVSQILTICSLQKPTPGVRQKNNK